MIALMMLLWSRVVCECRSEVKGKREREGRESPLSYRCRSVIERVSRTWFVSEWLLPPLTFDPRQYHPISPS